MGIVISLSRMVESTNQTTTENQENTNQLVRLSKEEIEK